MFKTVELNRKGSRSVRDVSGWHMGSGASWGDLLTVDDSGKPRRREFRLEKTGSQRKEEAYLPARVGDLATSLAD